MNKNLLKVCLSVGVMTLSSFSVSAGGINFMQSPEKLNRTNLDSSKIESDYFDLLRQKRAQQDNEIQTRDETIKDRERTIVQKDQEIEEKVNQITDISGKLNVTKADQTYLRMANYVESALDSILEKWKNETSDSIKNCGKDAEVMLVVNTRFNSFLDSMRTGIADLIAACKESLKEAGKKPVDDQTSAFTNILTTVTAELNSAINRFSLKDTIADVEIELSKQSDKNSDENNSDAEEALRDLEDYN